jgi:hypothetical protein
VVPRPLIAAESTGWRWQTVYRGLGLFVFGVCQPWKEPDDRGRRPDALPRRTVRDTKHFLLGNAVARGQRWRASDAAAELKRLLEARHQEREENRDG